MRLEMFEAGLRRLRNGRVVRGGVGWRVEAAASRDGRGRVSVLVIELAAASRSPGGDGIKEAGQPASIERTELLRRLHRAPALGDRLTAHRSQRHGKGGPELKPARCGGLQLPKA